MGSSALDGFQSVCVSTQAAVKSNMRSLIVLVLVFSALNALGAARKCYQCDDCENDATTIKTKTCGTGFGITETLAGDNFKYMCKKEVSSDGKIRKDCVMQQNCKMQKGLSDGAKKYGFDVEKIYCCDGELCNAATGLNSGVFGLLLAPAIALLAA